MSKYGLNQLQNAFMKAHKAGDKIKAKTLRQAILDHPEYKNQKQKPTAELIQADKQPEKSTSLVQKAITGAQKIPGMIVEGAKQLPGTIIEGLTGSKRKTEETEQSGEITAMPELNTLFSNPITQLALLNANDKETVSIIKKSYPAVDIKQDEKGNYIFKSAIDNRTYTMKPGLGLSDIKKGLATAVMFSPAGKLTNIGMKILGSALTQTGIEAIEKQAGGEFDQEQIALAGLTELIPPVISGALKIPGKTTKGISKVVQKVKPAKEAVQGPIVLGPEELGERIQAFGTAAAGRGKRQKKALQEIAEQARQDPGLVESAQRLDVIEELEPEHLTANQAYRDMAQSIKTVAGSKAKQIERQKMNVLSEKIADGINKVGGTTDLSTLDRKTFDSLNNYIDELKQYVRPMYKKVEKIIGGETIVNPKKIREYFEERMPKALNNKSNLKPAEIRVYNRLVEQDPTYSMVDELRKELIAGQFEKKGPFANAPIEVVEMLQGLISEDQRNIASLYRNALDIFEKAQKASAVYKGAQKDIAYLFGKEMQKSMIPNMRTSFRALKEGDLAGFLRLKEAIRNFPEHRQKEIITSGLATIIKDNKFGMTKFGDFADWYRKLDKQKTAKNALFSNITPEARQWIKDFYKISDAIHKTATAPRTGIQVVNEALYKGADNWVSNIINFATDNVAGMAGMEFLADKVGLPMGTSSIFAFIRAMQQPKRKVLTLADELLISPEFLSAIKTLKDEPEQAITKLSKSKPFKKYATALKIEDPKEWLRLALQSARETTERGNDERQNDQ